MILSSGLEVKSLRLVRKKIKSTDHSYLVLVNGEPYRLILRHNDLTDCKQQKNIDTPNRRYNMLMSKMTMPKVCIQSYCCSGSLVDPFVQCSAFLRCVVVAQCTHFYSLG